MSHSGNDQIIDAIRDEMEEEPVVKLLEQIETYGILRRKQGQAEGPGDWHMEPYDLRCDAEKLLKQIIDRVEGRRHNETALDYENPQAHRR